MTDCPTIEMRELLPDYLHDALTAPMRQRVEEHLATCAICAEELAVLRTARAVLSTIRARPIDTAAIVRALPRPGAPRLTLSSPSRETQPPAPHSRVVPRRSPTVFRIAAAISFISLGGISVAVARSYLGSGPISVSDSAVARVDAPVRPALALADSPTVATPASSRGLTLHASLSDLDDAALESLLGALDDLEAAPLAEPETTPGGRAFDGSITGS